MHKIFLILFSFFVFIFILNSTSYAQVNPSAGSELIPPREEKLEAVISKIVEEERVDLNGREQLYQKLELLITRGSLKGEKIIAESGNIPQANVRKFEVGDKVMVTASKDFEGKDVFYITDYIRRSSLYWLFGLFVGLTVLVGRKRGVAAILGMAFSFFVIFSFLLPQISAGKDPIFISILSSLFIIPVTFYLSHGFNRKTTAAIMGTVISLIITGILANVFLDAARLTGFASEEAGFVEALSPGLVNIRGLLLAGIIIGALGVLDDITISQAAVVHQLKQAVKNLTSGQLFSRAMNVGRDHIASVVNTLVLVYTGAALPLLLLFINNPIPFSEVINYEILAEEIVRTLVASIGLILAVPITTFLAAYLIRKK
ncbi:MAG: YibE/F family protein [Candidatus Levybacteria bacterium]|nr:YibE/F family protein [Candidatus Levybacteria bacterium]